MNGREGAGVRKRELAKAKADYTWWYSISSLYPQRHTHGLWSLSGLLNIAQDFRPDGKYVGIVPMMLLRLTDSYQNLVRLVWDLCSQCRNCNLNSQTGQEIKASAARDSHQHLLGRQPVHEERHCDKWNRTLPGRECKPCGKSVKFRPSSVVALREASGHCVDFHLV